MKNFGKNSRGRSKGVSKISTTPIYGAHYAVIFAIAQLSCFLLSSHLQEQESCAIANMTAQCTLCMGAMKILGTP